MVRKKKLAPTVWDNAQEVPRAGVPDAAKLARRFTLARRWWVVMPVVVSLAVAGLVASQQTGAGVIAQQEVSTPGRATAEQAVHQWLAADPSPLPGGTILSWEGAETEKVDTAGQASGSGTITTYTLERHRLTVADRAGRTYMVGVQVAVNEVLGARVTGEPALVPIAPAAQDSDWPDISGWPGLETAGAGEPVSNAVTAWASAYTSADPVVLQQQVSDPTPGRSYVPLTGVEAVTATVGSVATTRGTDVATAEEVIARVQLSLIWSSQVTDDQATEPTPVVMSYDVLIAAANTATPNVVAWGMPGSGPGLMPFENAVPRIVVADAANDLPVPNQTADAEDEPEADVSAGSTEGDQ